MYAITDRFRRDVFAGFSIQLMLAIVAICAITLGTGALASAAEKSLYAQATSSHGHHGHRNANGSKAKTPAIVTASGPLKGIIVGNISEFLGIPYAAPPVGNLRWTPPQPFGPWQGPTRCVDLRQPMHAGGRRQRRLPVPEYLRAQLQEECEQAWWCDARDVLDSRRRTD